MKIHALMKPRMEARLEKNQPDPRTYRSRWPYQEAYHGLNDDRISVVWNSYGKRPYKPRPLLRNIRMDQIPEVTAPHRLLFVRESIVRQLEWCTCIDLNPCEWTGVYDLPVDEKGIREIRAQFPLLADNFSEWLATHIQPPTPELKQVRCFELLAPDVCDVAGQFKCDAMIRLPPAAGAVDPEPTCSQLHREYPIVYCFPYCLLNEQAWDVFAPHVSDWELFTVIPIDVP